MQHRSRSATILGFALATSALAMPLALGCDDDTDGSAIDVPDGGAGATDAGGWPRADAGAGTDDAGAPAYPGEDSPPSGAGCFDFVDGDGDAELDCDDPDCASTPVCCVGRSSESCCRPATPRVVAFSECSGTGSDALLACAPGATLFGSPSPELRDFAFYPNGGDRYDSGLVLGGSVDPRVSRLSILASVEAEDACDGCLDSVAVGLTSSAATLGTTSLVDADVAFLVSAASGELRLVVGGAVSRAVPLADVRAMLGAGPRDAITYELATSTSGRVDVSASTSGPTGPWTSIFGGVRYAPRGPARVIAWGRASNRGPSDPPPAHLRRLEVSEGTCDAPASLERGNDVILPDAIDPWWSSGERTRAPSVVTYDDQGGERRARMAFLYQGRIHAAAGIDGGRFRALADPGDPESAMIAPGDAPWLAAVADPALLRGADRRWQLWFTAIADDGTTSIARAVGGTADSLAMGAPERVLAPTSELDTTVAWDSPSVIRTASGRTLLAARRRDADGTSEVALFAVDESGAPFPADTTIYDPSAGEVREDGHVVRRATGIATDFDCDEVAAPALIEYGGVLRLYYAGRRGTRWSIGVMLSQDGVHWREGNDGRAILAGSGAGFDALSTNDPAPVVDGAELRLYYTGSDGVRDAIGLARHAIPQGAVP
ncbi:hypothetical protein [Sandaracinus amylolyticus]|uniref:BNR repeat domain protein n=1 Tax=Sandaracinus amylolyticus TaxID=927083 RepID=A0A0F6YLA3_9BACT|nr:hypothetical protein [Sandaracinus amylolyticus]AKF08097.1 hypothetical protein DB32_005246 [Sandaracinus amylolyticus]